jgi:gamma-glutamyltranspeptidase/glutathione hydrolase
MIAAASILFLAACDDRPEKGEFATVEGFAGLVAGTEPRAVTVGRDVLGNGGTAADAAAAMYFVLTVAMPSRVGLGGGGVCIAFTSGDSKDRPPGAEVYEFLPQVSSMGGMLPRGIRAMAGLHARHGIMSWGEVVAPGEGLARFGHPVSRAFARDIAAASGLIGRSPALQRLLANRAGNLAREGDYIVQEELSGVLSGIRQQGAGYFHIGTFARRFAEASTAAGNPLLAEELRESLPSVVAPIRIARRSDYAYFAPPPVAGGLSTAQLWRILSDVTDFKGATAEAQDHILIESAQRMLAERSAFTLPDGSSRLPVAERIDGSHLKKVMSGFKADRHTPSAELSPVPAEIADDAHSAGFVVADRWGDGVACSFTMNGLFGSGRLAEGTGILLADKRPVSANFLTPVVIGNENTGDFRFAATAGGGLSASITLAAAMMRVLEDGLDLKQALKMPRISHRGSPDIAWYEPGLAPAVSDGLTRRGHDLEQVPAIGAIELIYCPRGILDHDEECQAASDPRGYGLAARAQ